MTERCKTHFAIFADAFCRMTELFVARDWDRAKVRNSRFRAKGKAEIIRLLRNEQCGSRSLTDRERRQRIFDLVLIFQRKIPRIEWTTRQHVELGIHNHGVSVLTGLEEAVDNCHCSCPAHTGVNHIETFGIYEPERTGHHVTVARFQKSSPDADKN